MSDTRGLRTPTSSFPPPPLSETGCDVNTLKTFFFSPPFLLKWVDLPPSAHRWEKIEKKLRRSAKTVKRVKTSDRRQGAIQRYFCPPWSSELQQQTQRPARVRAEKTPGEEVAAAAAALVDPEGKTRTGKHLAHLWIHKGIKSDQFKLRSRSGISAAAAAAWGLQLISEIFVIWEKWSCTHSTNVLHAVKSAG